MSNKQKDQEFQQWMKELNRKVSAIAMGFDTRDMADLCYRDYFDDGVSHEEIIEILAEQEGFEELL